MPIYKGNTKVVKLYKGTTQIIKRYKGTNIIYSASRLPSTFQEVEYLESSGTQYIDTGYLFYSSVRITMFAKYNSINSGRNFVISGSGRRKYIGANNGKWIVGYGSTTDYDHNLEDADTNKHTFDYQPTQYLIDSVVMKTFSSFSVGHNIGLFTTLPDTQYASNMVLYSCQIYDNNILVRNFVPCYRKADNVAGLYDLVNGVFYTNAGTGTFIVGGNV